MIYVLTCHFHSILQDKSAESFLDRLPAHLRTDANRYTDPLSRLQSAVGLLLLCRGTKTLYGQDIPDIARGKNGKPFFQGNPNLHFNISHTDALAACAFADRPIGLDIQTEQPGRQDLAPRVLCKQEQDWLDALPEDQQQYGFFKLWTRKESVVKNIGTGIGLGLQSLNVLGDTLHRQGQTYHLYHTYYNRMCHLALCSETAGHIEITDLDPGAL